MGRGMTTHEGRCPAASGEDRLWFALDMDDGVIAAASTRREVMRLAGVPTRAQWRGPWERHFYGPGSEEIVWGYRDEDSADSVFIEHGLGGLESGGWGHHLDGWRRAGAPVGVRVDEIEADR